jgi:hypothetical protein
MTIRIPKALAGVLLALIIGGAGVAVVYLVADTDSAPPDVRTTSKTSTQTSTTTVETNPYEGLDGVLGGEVMKDLIDSGAIGEATPVTPKTGWDTEFRVDRSGGEIRFRAVDDVRQIEWAYFQSAAGRALSDAIESAARERGYDPS